MTEKGSIGCTIEEARQFERHVSAFPVHDKDAEAAAEAAAAQAAKTSRERASRELETITSFTDQEVFPDSTFVLPTLRPEDLGRIARRFRGDLEPDNGAMGSPTYAQEHETVDGGSWWRIHERPKNKSFLRKVRTILEQRYATSEIAEISDDDPVMPRIKMSERRPRFHNHRVVRPIKRIPDGPRGWETVRTTIPA